MMSLDTDVRQSRHFPSPASWKHQDQQGQQQQQQRKQTTLDSAPSPPPRFLSNEKILEAAIDIVDGGGKEGAMAGSDEQRHGNGSNSTSPTCSNSSKSYQEATPSQPPPAPQDISPKSTLQQPHLFSIATTKKESSLRDVLAFVDVADERPIVTDDDYISLASTLATDSIGPLDAYEAQTLRRIRSNKTINEITTTTHQKKNRMKDVIHRKMTMLRQKWQRHQPPPPPHSEQRWRNSSSSNIMRDSSSNNDRQEQEEPQRKIVDQGLGPAPCRRSTMEFAPPLSPPSSPLPSVRSPLPSSPFLSPLPLSPLPSQVMTTTSDHSGIEVDEAIQVGFAVLRALKASSVGGSNGTDPSSSKGIRNDKKEEIMNHLHNMISNANTEAPTAHADRFEAAGEALEAVEEYLEMHQSFSNSLANSSNQSRKSKSARSLSMMADNAPSKPCRSKSTEDLGLPMNLENGCGCESINKLGSASPEFISPKPLTSETAHTGGTISMPSLVDIESLDTPLTTDSSRKLSSKIRMKNTERAPSSLRSTSKMVKPISAKNESLDAPPDARRQKTRATHHKKRQDSHIATTNTPKKNCSASSSEPR